MLETAKNEAHEALSRGAFNPRVRKSSLELSEAINLSDDIKNKKKHKPGKIFIVVWL